jgi:hypothetical protein
MDVGQHLDTDYGLLINDKVHDVLKLGLQRLEMCWGQRLIRLLLDREMKQGMECTTAKVAGGDTSRSFSKDK